MTAQTPQPFEEQARQITLAVRDWGEGLAKQQYDDDPLPGMSPQEATAALVAAHRAEMTALLRRVEAEVIGEPVKAVLNGRGREDGEKVTVDLKNNMEESVILIQQNGKRVLQNEQRTALAALRAELNDTKEENNNGLTING